MKEYEPPEVFELGDVEEVTNTGSGSRVVEGEKRGPRTHRGRREGHDKGQGKGHNKDSDWDWG